MLAQYASLGAQSDSCLGNLDLCRHGLLFAAWLKPSELREGADLLSTGANGLRAWVQGGRVHVSARTLTREWTVDTDALRANAWQFVEVREVVGGDGDI